MVFVSMGFLPTITCKNASIFRVYYVKEGVIEFEDIILCRISNVSFLFNSYSLQKYEGYRV